MVASPGMSSSKNMPIIVWIRRDLRLDDNPALLTALEKACGFRVDLPA